jgi:hypothetical protein
MRWPLAVYGYVPKQHLVFAVSRENIILNEGTELLGIVKLNFRLQRVKVLSRFSVCN